MSFTKSGQSTVFSSGVVMYGGKVLKTDPDFNQSGAYEPSGNTLNILWAGAQPEKHTVMAWNKATDSAHAKLSDEELIFDGLILDRSR